MVTVGNSVRARLGSWPYEPDVAQIVLLDHHMIPTVTDVGRWVAEADPTRTRCIRTGALFPEAADAFVSFGFHTIDTLALLETELELEPRLVRSRTILPRSSKNAGPTTQRVRQSDLGDIAMLDRAAFGDPWGNDEASLRDVMAATPRSRARIVRTGRQIEGFAISGQSGHVGYLQRLAVRPEARRSGVANALVADAMSWMRRRRTTTVMVNTAVDNLAALALYDHAGFTRRTETLSILELSPR